MFAGDYTQNGPNGSLQFQVVTNQGLGTTQAAAGHSYDTLAATGNVFRRWIAAFEL